MNILNVEKVSKAFGEKVLLDNVTLGINKGDKIGIIGVNGTGKSTLLKIIAGIEEPDEGNIIKGRKVTVTYLAQSPDYIKDENVLSYVLRGKDSSNEPKAKEILNKLGIDVYDAPMDKLSGGQKKRVALAKVLVEPTEVLILDEPTNHLDNDMVVWLERYIKAFKGELLMVTHDRYFLDNVTNRIVELDKVVAGGKHTTGSTRLIQYGDDLSIVKDIITAFCQQNIDHQLDDVSSGIVITSLSIF